MHCSFYRNFFLAVRFKFNLISFKFMTRASEAVQKLKNIVKRVGYHSNQPIA